MTTSDLLSPELLLVCSTNLGEVRGGPGCYNALQSKNRKEKGKGFFQQESILVVYLEPNHGDDLRLSLPQSNC